MGRSSERFTQLKESDSLLASEVEEPRESAKLLEKSLAAFWRGDYDQDVMKTISESLRDIEGAVCKKYQQLPETQRKRMDIGDFVETLDAISELRGGFQWIYRFPALIITVAIASLCIPVAMQLDEVIIKHPILGGFPPAISAAAGCIGIQNTAIIVRALNVKVMKTSRLFAFVRYVLISCSLSLGAAILEMFVAWIVVSAENDENYGKDPWSASLLLTDVPIVIFFAMFITGALAGVIGAGVPLFISKLSEMINKRMDPAHWVGPIETVAQELCAASLTFWIAGQFVFPKE